jgi:peptidoglycan/LPS O-acetylase OafA/YrhL
MELLKSFPRLLWTLPSQNYNDIDLDTPLIYEDEDSEIQPEVSLPIVNRNKRLYTALSQTASTIAVFLVPSFFQRKNPLRPQNITETSYLNGVRGLASLLVYFQHIATEYGDWIHYGYYSRPDDKYFIQLPFIRLLYSGRFMVAIFFVLSGYVLSYRPLQLSRKHNTGLLFDNLASGLFRRAPRLFLPVVPVILITAIFGIYYGCYGTGRPSDGECNGTEPSLWLQIVGTWNIFVQMLDPFTWSEFYPPGVPQLWTLPMEFRGSIAVFMLILALGNVKPPVRLVLLLSAAYACFHFTRWDTLLFVCGVILAELRILRKTSPYTLEKLCKNSALASTIRLILAIFWVAILALALFIGSWPANLACQSPGFQHICSYTPSQYSTGVAQQYFWIFVAAILLLLSLENFEPLQQPFVTPLANYFGEISFGLYIVHFPFLQTIGRWVIVTTIRSTGNPTFGYQEFPRGFFLGGVLITPFIIWLADIHCRLFDVKSVSFARWLSLKCFVSKE